MSTVVIAPRGGWSFILKWALLLPARTVLFWDK